MRAQSARLQAEPMTVTEMAQFADSLASEAAPAVIPTVVHGRHTVVTEGFRSLATEKLRCVTKFDHKVIRLEVEVSSEHNPRQSHACERVQITCVSRGPVVRAEAAAQDAYAALDLAVGKLEERLRRAADRRHSRGARISRLPQPRLEPEPQPDPAPAPPTDLVEGTEDGPFLVREKVHASMPMTLDEALANMELVGHDFYLFRDAGCGSPSVVYRRRGYHYGVLRLGDGTPDETHDETSAAAAADGR